MSTFFGGEQLVSVTSIDAQYSADATIYTVPSGHYAKIVFAYANAYNNNAILYYTTSWGTETICSATNSESKILSNNYNVYGAEYGRDRYEIILNSGNVLAFDSNLGNLQIKAMVFTYKKP